MSQTNIIGNRYTLLEVLGEGGMGTVYLGQDTVTNQQVAIKQLKTEIVQSDREFVERFAREAEALRVLNHPNIVKVLETLEEEGTHYLVMEYVGGGALSDLLAETPQLPVEHVLEIALDLADALTRAHRVKIIHRDIKPANVLLADDGTPRLTDFGVARIDSKTRVTQTGAIIGTMNYLSPEVLEGSPSDDRADIWAFGVLLYEMLAGARPFDETSMSSLITAILTKSIPDLREMRPDAPESLVQLIELMLSKDPDIRINSVRKVGAEIENIIRGVDSDEFQLDPEIKEAVAHQEKSRFESITPTSPPQIGIRKHGVTQVVDENGQKFVVIPKRMAVATRVISVLLVLSLAIAIIVIVSSPSAPDTTGTSQLAPVPDDKYMVLVAKPEHFGGDERDVQRFIVEDLKEHFESNIPFSNLLIRSHDGIITNIEDAYATAKQNNATLIVWGNYDVDGIELHITFGALDKFKNNVFIKQGAEGSDTGGSVALITDERKETIAPWILGVMSVLHTADSNLFEFMRVLAMLEKIRLPEVELTASSGVDQYYTLYFANYLTDTEAAVKAMDDAIDFFGADPFAYIYRAIAEARLGRLEEANRDAITASRLAPPTWAMPVVIRAITTQDIGEIESLMTEAINLRPDDWFLYVNQTVVYYGQGKIDAAWENLRKSIELGPQANYPYVFGFILAAREGDIETGAQMIQSIVRDHPDPAFGNLVFEAAFGKGNLQTTAGGTLFEAMGNLIIGQHERAIDAFRELFGQLPQLMAYFGSIEDFDYTLTIADYYLIQGLAFCGKGDTDAALNAYNTGITLNPDFKMLYVQRSELYAARGETENAQADIANARGLNPAFDEYIDDTVSGKVTCNNFFQYFVNIADQKASGAQ